MTKRRKLKPLVPIRTATHQRLQLKEKAPTTKVQTPAANRAPNAHNKTASRSNEAPTASTTNPERHSAWQCASIIDQQAAHAVQQLLRSHSEKRHGASLKSLVLAPHIQSKKATYAVTCETLKHAQLLQAVISKSRVCSDNPKLTEATALVLLQELLFGKGLKRNGPGERLLLSQKEHLQELLQQEQAAQEGKSSTTSAASKAAETRPRWARVNLLKMTPEQLVQRLRAQPSSSDLADQVEWDDLLADLARFPPGTDLHDHPLVAEGCLVLQSKASCMPARALAPEPGWHVVDCCAAPGNKTTHAAALVGAEGRVFAFDRDPRRLKRLKDNAKRCGAANVVAEEADFLQVDPMDPKFTQVQGVILDPSCSGSGTAVSRMDYLREGGGAGAPEAGAVAHEAPVEEQHRVEQLAKFQEAALLHALKFPALQRLVYSTCSTYQRENEDVVEAVLPAAREMGFTLVDPFPAWQRRGLATFPDAAKLIRTDPFKDETDGFFVAAFQRPPHHTEAGSTAPPGGEPNDHSNEHHKKQKKKKKRKRAEQDQP